MPELNTAAAAYGVFARDMLPERIASRLVSLITERQLRPGDKLPPERELAAAMQVSRPSLREALRALAMVNIVEIRQGSGTYITSLKPELLVEHLDFVFALDDSTFAELLEARQMLEPSIAAAAAHRATEEDLVRLRACIDRAARAADDPDSFLAADLELHEIITAAAHNQIMARFMASLTRLGLASRSRTVALPGVRARSIQDHQALVNALQRRDADAAAGIMREHLEHIHATLSESAVHDGTEAISSGGQHVADYHMG
jgi:GntR family transcriptional regulator, transcriptional repressor for pyruvate dehydrogenase complex